MPAQEKLGVVPFRPRSPWWGPDLQTVRNFLVAPPAALPGERVWFDTNDGSGDRMTALVNRPVCAEKPRSTIILVHGLSGSEASLYMTPAARHFAEQGHTVLRLNLRGAGPSRSTCHDHYHAGRSEDLAHVVDALPESMTRNGVVLIGISLGGSLALKYCAETGSKSPISALVSVSAPIDLTDTCLNMLRRRNSIYHQRLLADFKRERLTLGDAYTPEEAAVIEASRNFLEVDDRFFAPRFGYANVWDYYERCAAQQFMGAIKTPTLMIHALDDPIVPATAYRSYRWADNPNLHPLLPEQGGHVGFHGTGPVPWYLYSIDRFLARFGAD
jgi:predicted alpha/beta-fold hydrolase